MIKINIIKIRIIEIVLGINKVSWIIYIKLF